MAEILLSAGPPNSGELFPFSPQHERIARGLWEPPGPPAAPCLFGYFPGRADPPGTVPLTQQRPARTHGAGRRWSHGGDELREVT